MIRVTFPDNIEQEPPLKVEEVSDPSEMAKAREQDEAARRNSEWLQDHWADIVPHGLGQFLVVAGRQAFLAPTGEVAAARAKAAHPEDKGMLFFYLRPEKGPRIYGIRRHLVPVP